MSGTNHRAGFSVTELMTVVAIISIITIVSVSQFQRFTRRAQEASLRVELSNVYSASRAFALEYGVYSTALNQIGYVSNGPSARYYRVGFPSGSQVCTLADPAMSSAFPNQVTCPSMPPHNAQPHQSLPATIVAPGGPAGMQTMMTGTWVGNVKTPVYSDPNNTTGSWKVYGLRMTEPGQLEIFSLNERKNSTFELLDASP